MIPATTSANRIRVLNDAVRSAGPAGAGRWVLTARVMRKGTLFGALAMRAVQEFDGFTPGNDPYGENDFGSFNIAGETLLWKIDYYDQSLEAGSDDPADPAITRRVLTVMLASEY